MIYKIKKLLQKLILKKQRFGKLNRFNDYPLLCGTDTSSGVAKEINRKLLELSKFKELPYGNDKFTELATKKFRKVFNQKNIEFLPMISGTASNALALSLMSKQVDNIICHKEAHILIQRSKKILDVSIQIAKQKEMLQKISCGLGSMK